MPDYENWYECMERMREIEDLITPALETMGYEVVRVRMLGRRKRTLQAMAERRDRRPMTVDDCAEISRVVSALLDVSDPIHGPYELEISSPGIDRPLIRMADFRRFTGHVAKIELSRRIDGHRRVRGRIVAQEGDHVRIHGDDGEMDVPIGDISDAQLVLTDELIAATAEGGHA